MTFKPTDTEARTLRAALRHHDILYRRGEPEITDSEYDGMFRMLQNWERDHPHLATPDSPTQIVEHEDDGTEQPWHEERAAQDRLDGVD
ncbi:MAG: hypothetical protein GY716_15865 [bacterium]|nr:hypothetical protein [bacterium]